MTAATQYHVEERPVGDDIACGDAVMLSDLTGKLLRLTPGNAGYGTAYEALLQNTLAVAFTPLDGSTGTRIYRKETTLLANFTPYFANPPASFPFGIREPNLYDCPTPEVVKPTRPGNPRGVNDMSDAQHAAVLAYIEALQGALKLRDWNIFLEREFIDLEGGNLHFAECAVVTGRRSAFISVGPNFFDESPAAQRDALVHELLHVYVDQTKVASACLMPVLTTKCWQMFQEIHQTAIEFAVEGITASIVGFYTLPDFPLE